MTKYDLKLARQIKHIYICNVKVCQLDQLGFEGYNIYGSRSIDKKNVKQLLHRFNKETCCHLDLLI
jgi:hypothetical protein